MEEQGPSSEPVPVRDITANPKSLRARCARLTVDFLEAIFYKFTSSYCDLPVVKLDSFCGILYERSFSKVLFDYCEKIKETLRYWIMERSLQRWSVVFSHGDQVVIEVCVDFFATIKTNWDKINEPKEVLTELKNKLVHAFIDLDKLPGKEEIKKITNGKELSAEIHCTLLPETGVPEEYEGYQWDYAMETLNKPSRDLYTALPRRSSRFVEFTINLLTTTTST